MEACFAERHVLWKEIHNGGYIVRLVVMYLGLTYFGKLLLQRFHFFFVGMLRFGMCACQE